MNFKLVYLLILMVGTLFPSFAEESILILGTSRSIESGVNAYDLASITSELQTTLNDHSRGNVQVSFEDIYASRDVLFGLGGGGTEYTWEFRSHSLLQYWTWPEGHADKLDLLRGDGSYHWDKVVILADPYIQTMLPGYYALGLNQVAHEIAQGGAQVYVVQPWVDPSLGVSQATLDQHLRSITSRMEIPIQVILSAEARLEESTPDDIVINESSGSSLIASTIYEQLYEGGRTFSDLSGGDPDWSLASPFALCDLNTTDLTYQHTGTSSERGILRGLKAAFNASSEFNLTVGSDVSPYSFNYGRANTYFEANKRYQLDSTRFSYSFGFPMQDHSNYGDVSMLYGLDWRQSNTENGTDLGVARKMIRDSEVPLARAVPIRTLYAFMKAAIPGQSAYSDSWHMDDDLDKASGAFMYTILTGDFPQYDEPSDSLSAEWRSWKSIAIGHQTAWTLATLESLHPEDLLTSFSAVGEIDLGIQLYQEAGNLYFESSEIVDGIQIIDLQGKLLLNTRPARSEGVIPLGDLIEGVYGVRFHSRRSSYGHSLVIEK